MELSTSIPTRNTYGPRPNVVWHSSNDYDQRLVGDGITSDSLGHEVGDIASHPKLNVSVNKGGRALDIEGSLVFT